MGHFAHIDSNGIVTHVIVAELDFINSGAVGEPSEWLQTSYNTRCGIHYDSDGKPDGGVALRKNYAGVGYSYDKIRDAFIPPKPYNSWVLNETTCNWDPPSPMPIDGKLYYWDESSVSWKKSIVNT